MRVNSGSDLGLRHFIFFCTFFFFPDLRIFFRKPVLTVTDFFARKRVAFPSTEFCYQGNEHERDLLLLSTWLLLSISVISLACFEYILLLVVQIGLFIQQLNNFSNWFVLFWDRSRAWLICINMLILRSPIFFLHFSMSLW